MRFMLVALMAMAVGGCGDDSSAQDMAGNKDMSMSSGDMTGSTMDMAGSGSADMSGFQSLTPCTSMADYMTGKTTINFGGSLGSSYSPNCLSVKAGTMVNFMGDFTAHPLSPSTRGTTPSPITATSSGTSAQFTFANPGFYPYFCTVHGSDSGGGMAGVVQVTP